MGYIDVAELELRGCNDATGYRGMREDVQDPWEKMMVLFAEQGTTGLDERIEVRNRGVLQVWKGEK